jgi:hypothetical protein
MLKKIFLQFWGLNQGLSMLATPLGLVVVSKPKCRLLHLLQLNFIFLKLACGLSCYEHCESQSVIPSISNRSHFYRAWECHRKAWVRSGWC